jgi:Aspartyl protease
MARLLPRRATLWLLLYYLTRVRGIPFAGTRTASTASSMQASETEESDQQPREPRGISSSYLEANGLHGRSAQGGESWLEGFELEAYEDHAHYDGQYAQDYHDVLSSLQSHPLLQVPCLMAVKTTQEAQEPLSSVSDSSAYSFSKPHPIRCFCDTGAQKTVMSARSAQMAGLMTFLDRRYADKSEAVGVGGSTCRVLGRIPPGVATLKLYGHVDLPSPAIVVLEDLCGVDLLLGLDFLREYDAILDLGSEEMQLSVQGKTEYIPFIKPRGGSSVGGPISRQHDDAYTESQSANREGDSEVDQSDCYEDEESGGFALHEPLDMSGV